MNDTLIATTKMVAVLLADGWHRIVPGSFRIGPLSFEAEAGPGTPGFRFEEEAETGSPYRPATLAGPLASIIAVRQVTSAVRRLPVEAIPHGQPRALDVRSHGAAFEQLPLF